MELIPTFVKRLSSAECRSNRLILPHALCVEHGSGIPRGVKLVVRNGFGVWLDYNRTDECFEGMHSFFQFLNITGGETLLLQHSGGFEFKAAIFDIYGAEKEYPNMPNAFLRDVTIQNGGWSFLEHIRRGPKLTDSIVVPFEFFERDGVRVPPKVYYQVSSGYEVVGSFSETTNRIYGLISICNMLNAPNLNGLEMLVFTFDGVSKFAVRAFGESLVEIPIGPTISAIGESSDMARTAFKFKVQACHMLHYEHGVDIPVHYRDLCKLWFKTDYITAYLGMRCWKLQICHRSDRKRTTINDGWLIFRTDLQIEEGDICVFE